MHLYNLREKRSLFGPVCGSHDIVITWLGHHVKLALKLCTVPGVLTRTHDKIVCIYCDLANVAYFKTQFY